MKSRAKMLNPQALGAQSIALAGLFQALEQVQHCARSGAPSNPVAMSVVLESALRIDAPDAQSVYGNVCALRAGMSLLAQHLARRSNAEHLELTRYVASLLSLERRLVKSSLIASQLTDALHEIVGARAERAIDDPWMVQQLAGAYSKHISPLGPRVMVSGNPVHLQMPANAERIRALLLAGLRAAVLWRQCGGSQIKLLIYRKPMQRAVARALELPR